MWVAGLVVAVLGLAAIVSQLGGAGRGAPLNAVAAAAVKTQEQQGGRAVVHLLGSSPGGKSFTGSGRMAFDASGRVRAVLMMRPEGSTSAIEMEMVTDGAVVYMHSPKIPLPQGLKWMKIDFEATTGLKLPVPSGSDPREELARLEAVANVRKLGEENVRGVPTTRYRATMGIAETVKALREEGEEEFAESVEKAGTPQRLEVWIGPGGLVRRLRVLNLGSPSEGNGTTADISIDFFDFGLEPRIDVPDSSEVFDATSLAESS